MEKMYKKVIVGNWNYAQNYYKAICKDLYENPNTKIDYISCDRPFRREECKKPNAVFTFRIYYK